MKILIFYIFSFYLYLRNAIKERVEKCFDAIKKIESCEGSLLNFANSYLNFGIRPKGDYLYIKGKILKKNGYQMQNKFISLVISIIGRGINCLCSKTNLDFGI